jgi:glycerol-3-phosphate O-acyltransferase
MTDLSFRVIRELNANLHITISSLVATFLLNDRKGIDFDQLVEKVRWLQGELLRVGAHIAFEGGTERLCLGALNILGPLVRKRRNMIEPATEQGNISAVLVLSLYRNQVIHIFVDHGMFAVALLSGGEGRPVKQSELLDKYKFLKRLLNMEFPRFPDPNLTTANQVLSELVERQVFRWTTVDSEPAYELMPDSAGYITFLCNLLWPFLESYLVGCLTLLSIRPAVEVEKNALHQRMGWLAERMFEEGRLCFEESCVMDTLDNAIAAFTKLGLITRFQKTITNKKDKKKSVTKVNPLLPFDGWLFFPEKSYRFPMTHSPIPRNSSS